MNQTTPMPSINTTATFESEQQQELQFLGWEWFLPIPFVLFCFVILPLLLIVDRCLLRLEQRDDDDDEAITLPRDRAREAPTRTRNEGEENASIKNPLTKLNKKQRTNVYKQVFQSSQNSIVLTKEYFLGCHNKIIEKSEMRKQEQEQEQQHTHEKCKSEEFVDMELGGDISSSSPDDDANTKDNDVSYNDTHKSCWHSNRSMICSRQQPHQLFVTNDGTCIICFEEFAVGDIIVWSEDPDCSHIYHEDCMIQYLTTKPRSKEIVVVTNDDSDTDGDSTNDHSNTTEDTEDTEDTTSSDSDRDSDNNDIDRDNRQDPMHKDNNKTVIEKNPSPTCRRTFCTVTIEDFNSITSRCSTTGKELASC